MKKSFVRISALLSEDILVAYALFVMQNYLTKVWKLSFTHAAAILNVWGGISMLLPSFFIFIVDALLGNFRILVLSSVSYAAGISLVAMSMPPVLANSTGTCKQYAPQCIGHVQKALFYAGMALIAVGIAGNLVSVKPFLDEQKDSTNGSETSTKDIWKLPGFCFVVLVPVIGAIALPYIRPWSIRFGIPAICAVVTTFCFLTGWRTYEKIDPQGSPFTNVCRVFVAVVLKISKPLSPDAQFYQNDDDESQTFPRTRFLRCLEKAAVILPDVELNDQVSNRWRLCTISEVEDAKIVVRMIPMWLTFIVCGIVSSIGNTYFVEQANHMNRKIGKWKVPLPILLLLFEWAKSFFASLASSFLKDSKKYSPPIGIAIAMVFSILCCITAARIETKRLGVIERHGLLDKPEDEIPMSVFWLLFQFFLLAGLGSFLEKSVVAFFNCQSPKSMRKYIGFFSKGVLGLGFMCTVLSVYVVGRVTERGGKTKNWFQFTLNRSRLDRYYWVLAGLSSANLLVFILVASCYRYNNNLEATDEEPMNAGENGLPSDSNGEAQCSCFG